MNINKKLLDIFKNTKTTSDEYTYTCSYINDLVEDVYSTSEVKTNKVWIDGKPIYRKVVETSFTGTQVSKTYTLSNLGLSSVSTFTKLKSISNHDPIEEDYYAGTNDYVRTFINNTGLNIVIGSSYPTKPVTIYTIVEYTKTTD